MKTRRLVLALCGAAVAMAGVLMSPLVRDDGTAVSARAESQPDLPPLDGAAVIVPSREDFAPEMAARVRLPRRKDRNKLLPIPSGVVMDRALGGGWGSGPSWMDESTVPTGGGVPDRFWSASVRYVVYRSPEDARSYWDREDSNRQVRCGGGSFSGEKIGDWCGHIAHPGFGMYELHVVQSNVSVNLSTRVMVSPKVESETDMTDFRPDVEEALEATAKVIVNRIDGVVKAKGRVDMSNLPPVIEFP